MNIEQKVLDATIEMKEKYYGASDWDSKMSDLETGKLLAYRQVLDWFTEERNEAVADVFRKKAELKKPEFMMTEEEKAINKELDWAYNNEMRREENEL